MIARVKPRSYERPILTTNKENGCRADASPADTTSASEALALQQQHSRVRPLPMGYEFPQEIQGRRQDEDNSSHEKFANRGVRENPNDGEDRQRRYNFHSREIERLTI